MTGCGPRLNTQTLSLRSTATPEHSPKFQPLGSCAQFLTTLWGREGPDLSSAEAGASVSDTAINRNSDLIAGSVYMTCRVCYKPEASHLLAHARLWHVRSQYFQRPRPGER